MHNRLIHLTPLQEALAPFPVFAAVGGSAAACPGDSAAAGGRGAIAAPSSAAGAGAGHYARELDPVPDAAGAAAESESVSRAAGFAVKRRLMILAWGRPPALGTLRTSVVRGQSVAQFCPKLVRGNFVKLLQNGCLVYKYA
jgi:hypothetical protein